MGATQTTFCNEADIPISTGLSVLITYYFTETLLPQQCVTYNVGRVWFTAFAHLSSGYDPDSGFGQIYFLTNETTAVGVQVTPALIPIVPGLLKYLRVTRREAKYIMAASPAFVEDDFDAVANAYMAAACSVYTQSTGYYAGSSHKIWVTGGPKRTIAKIDDYEVPAHIIPYKKSFRPFQMEID
ncbi:uncharacterized protein LOC110861975 [Folsomia candida]|uniref:Uncharacterized protein n=1 Tax=Folsomia candida TaxID=158441 RepID=A0A226CYB7_FOLCA|nr:uncharacterized protein LOC110861975 [Folsomia candida]OXA38312.1 hypothetical protein Fcan01_26936 [Folsomia candida]